jgi:phytoene dehydrogenase-like protein
MDLTPDVIIVGAGLAGLCCAGKLKESGISFQILEASDGVGGRVRTDEVDGFLLDRGFQVLLTAYPEAKSQLDYSTLNLRHFYPGALVYFDRSFKRVADPARRLLEGFLTIFSPVGSILDKVRVAWLRNKVEEGSIEDLFQKPEMTTFEELINAGFSEEIIDRFFRPFFGGIFLDPELSTSSRMFEFIFRMLSKGDISIPAKGMGAISEQLAARLPADSIRTGIQVVSVEESAVTLTVGEKLRARAIVVATDGDEAARLTGLLDPPHSRSVTCLYFSSDEPPVSEPILILNGEKRGPVNSLSVISQVAPSYAPSNRSLISVNVLGSLEEDDEHLESSVRGQLTDWFGTKVENWKHLRTYRIANAQPEQSTVNPFVSENRSRLKPGIYICGDHRDNGSINGALMSGRKAAEAIIQDFK